MLLNATQLAAEMNVSKPRVSQWVRSGALDGCFTGEGRGRRFDLAKVKEALQQNLDPAQMLGNGAKTKKVIRSEDGGQAAPVEQDAPRRDGVLPQNDIGRYELARIHSAEEDARRKRRDNKRDEGRWVLAEAAERTAADLVAKEVGQFEAVLRDGARAVADKLGVDYRSARALLMDEWRRHRTLRASQLAGSAAAAQLTEAEREEDI